jgi:hypothetical protein
MDRGFVNTLPANFLTADLIVGLRQFLKCPFLAVRGSFSEWNSYLTLSYLANEVNSWTPEQ